MAVIQYITTLINNLEPFSHADVARFRTPYHLSESGDLAGEAPEDCLRRYRLFLKRISQGDCGLSERSRQIGATLFVETACPASMPGLWIDLYFEEESLRLLRLLCGRDHSQAGLLSVRHVESLQSEAGKSLVLFRHEFELHYLNGTGE